MNSINISDGCKRIKEMLVLSGRELGYEIRDKIKLDEKDRDSEKYNVIFPDNIISISTSFFLALFGESVRTLKDKESFLSKYNFSCDSNMMININDGIVDALNDVDGLS